MSRYARVRSARTSAPRSRLLLMVTAIIFTICLFMGAQWAQAQETPPSDPVANTTPLPEILTDGIVAELIAPETSIPDSSMAPFDEQEADGALVLMAMEAMNLLNAQRVLAGCAPLAVQPILNDVATAHSREMAEAGYFGHTSLAGLSPGKRAAAAGYQWIRYAENIAAGYSTASGAVNGWLASEGHRNNLLNCAYTETGLGVWHNAGSPYRYYWTHDIAVRNPDSALPTPTRVAGPTATPLPTSTPARSAATPAQIPIPSAFKVRLPVIGGR